MSAALFVMSPAMRPFFAEPSPSWSVPFAMVVPAL